MPTEGLTVALSYTYLDGDMPPQSNPLAGGATETFVTQQTPRHAGSLSLDYRFSPRPIGTFSTHLDITSTDRYSYVTFSPASQRFDAYTLVNARLALSDIAIGHSGHSFTIALWGRNLTDEEYIVFALPDAQAFGTPRTAGIDISYRF